MSNTRREKHESGDVQSVSPAKPMMGASVNGMQTFFYKKTNKPEGLSPNGKHTIPLSKYEGEHHIKGRDESGEIMTGDSPIKMQRRHDLPYYENKLLLKLIALKNRTDQDYWHYETSGEISHDHYVASRIKIRECISLLKVSYELNRDKDAFLHKLNEQIQKNGLYNPFYLQYFYLAESFDADQYKATCQQVNYRCGLMTENFVNEENHLMKRSREADSSMIPRNVKRRVLEDEKGTQSSNGENRASVVRKIMF